MRTITFKYTLALILAGVFITACGPTNDIPATPVPTDPPTPEIQITRPPDKVSLIVCLGTEPNTLYPYGRPNAAALNVLQAINDGPLDLLGYQSMSVILEKVPSLADGDAEIQTVSVLPGQTVLNDSGNPAALEIGLSVRPAGCRSAECALFYDGGELEMEQMTVMFQLKAGLKWADGAPLTALDSQYAFNLNAAPESLASKDMIFSTASYVASDDLNIVWAGIPGFLDAEYERFFWTPAPQHLWMDFTAEELISEEISASKPLGFGPYQIQEWEPGSHITLVPNPNYWRADENLPAFDPLIFQFVGENAVANLELLLSGDCDLLDEVASQNIDRTELVELESQGELLTSWANGNAWELINIGIVPRSYDDGYRQIVGDRPNYFGDVRTRQAIALCLDRQKIVAEISFGQGSILNTYVPDDHPLYNSEAATYPQDMAAADELFNEVGWIIGEDGTRISQAIPEIRDNTRFTLSYWSLSDDQSLAIAQIIARNLIECGIEINLAAGSAEEFLAPGPAGLIFGRAFDLAQFSWQTSVQPPCHLYFSDAVPGADPAVFSYSWGGWNLTGWISPEYDQACTAAQAALPGQNTYLESHLLAQAIFAEELPVIPLFIHQKVVVARPDFCNLALDPTAGAFWNIESFGYGDLCS